MYNIRRLVKLGYLRYERLKADNRSVGVSLTSKGKDARAMLATLHKRQLLSLSSVADISTKDLAQTNRSLERLETFWIDQMRFRL